MDRPFIERLQIENYGCIKDLELKLTPLHALIGPNDSGKSTVLMALRTLTTLATRALRDDYQHDGAKLLAALEANAQLLIKGVASSGAGTWAVRKTPSSGISDEWTDPQHGNRSANRNVRQDVVGQRGALPQLRAMDRSVLLRLEPDEMRKPTHLIQEGRPLQFATALGLGLPAIYDAIVTRDLPAYIAINDRLKTLYPTVKSLSLKNTSPSEKTLGIQLHDGTFVGADFMSEGMLYYLAFAALPHLEPAAVVLIEEPENGLHPARIREVIQMLREVAKTTQIVLATHSPLVINELQPDEVTVLTRKPEEGTRGMLLRDTPNFAERSKVYALGELWVSYADGNYEEPLFTEPEPAPPSGEPVEWNEGDHR